MSGTADQAKLRVGFIGDMTGDAGSELAGQLHLQPVDRASLDGVAGVLIDGTVPDGGTIGSILDSGKPLAIVNPKQGLLDVLDRITGVRLSAAAALTICKRNLVGPGYTAFQFSSESGVANAISAESGPTPMGEIPPPAAIELAPAIVSAFMPVRSPELSLAGARTALAAGPSLTPPQGATYGVSRVHPIPPLVAKWQCTSDKTAGDRWQVASSPANVDFHVYYVDGESGAPYYIVILKLTGSFSPGGMLANNKNSIGYFQYAVTMDAAVSTHDQKPFGPQVTLAAHAPTNFAADSVPVDLNVPMVLIVNDQGRSRQEFSAGQQSTTTIPQWELQDTTSSAGPSWYYHQAAVWDPSANPPNDFSNWWEKVFANNGQGDDSAVLPMPNLSYSSLTYNALAAWRFDASLIKNAKTRSLPVFFNGHWVQNVALFHNPDGSKVGHHQLYTMSGAFWWGWYMDLGAVAVQTR